MLPYRQALAALVLVGCGGKIDPTEDVATRRVGTVQGSSSGGGSSSSSSSSGGTALGACSSVGFSPLAYDFESGAISGDFDLNTPSAFAVDYDDPISGSASLRVKPTPASFIARKMKNVCAARLQFTLRASQDFLDVGSHVARINAGSRRFSIFVGPSSVFMLEEVSATSFGGLGSGPSYGQVYADDPTTFTLDVDLNAKKVTFGLKSAKGGGETRVLDMADFELVSQPAITSVELGTTPGAQANPKGSYSLDDVTID